MTPPDFSVLLLAWDDADPQVAVLGGSALPPTLPLVYQLSTQHPVVALYPHLPPDAPTAPPAAGLPAPAPETAAPAETPTPPASPAPPTEALTTTTARPGVQLLPVAAGPDKASPLPQPSRLIGLADLAPAGPAPAVAAPAQSIIEHPEAVPPTSPARNQWPTGINAPAVASQWEAPAAPYLGAGVEEPSTPLPPARPQPEGPPASQAQAAPSKPDQPDLPAPAPAVAAASAPPRQHRLASDLRFDPDPELPAITMQQPALFDERTEEVGAAEATDIAAPADDLVPDAPAATPPAAPPAAPAPAAPLPAPAPHMPALEGLNFRMIQYARQAAQLVRAGEAFGVIYAPNWPAWLAALEIRNSTRRPLVLYVAALAHDFAGPAERGWLPELERMTLRRATLVLVPDEGLRRRLRAHYGAGMGEVRIVAAADEAAVQGVLNEVAAG
jgi:hypothetical protein